MGEGVGLGCSSDSVGLPAYIIWVTRQEEREIGQEVGPHPNP